MTPSARRGDLRAHSTRAAIVVVLGAVVTLMGACDLAISLPDTPGSIAESLCKCEGTEPFFPSALGCERYVEEQLALDPAVSAQWIARFGAEACDDCAQVSACTAAEPVCVPAGGECLPTRNETCCGFDASNAEQIYCFTDEVGNSRCLARDTTCEPTGATCSAENPSVCCGFCLGLDESADVGICVDRCQPNNDVACPGCCARYDVGPLGFGVCIDFVVDGVNLCEELSCTDADGCPITTACVPHTVPDDDPLTVDPVLYFCDKPVGG